MYKEEGCKNESADMIRRENITWSDMNLTDDFSKLNGTFERLICTCGNLSFEVLITGSYETSAQCIKCKKYYIVHSG